MAWSLDLSHIVYQSIRACICFSNLCECSANISTNTSTSSKSKQKTMTRMTESMIHNSSSTFSHVCACMSVYVYHVHAFNILAQTQNCRHANGLHIFEQVSDSWIKPNKAVGEACHVPIIRMSTWCRLKFSG